MFKNNPIFFKDLLIALNSKQWKIVIFFFIFIYFIAFLLFLSEIKFSYNFYEISNIWRELFLSVWISQLFVLTGISFFRWLQSFTNEKTAKTLDFIKISPISPIKFVLWKFLASISFVLLLFIISLPFLSIWLVLWWVNISDILIYSLYTISYTSFAVLFWMYLSSLSKNTIISILYWVISVPVLIFFIAFFMWYSADYFWFDFMKNWDENILFAIFPISIFGHISDSMKYIDFFNLKIHYLFFHLYFFWILNYFLFYYLTKQYKKFSDITIKTFNYTSTLLLTLLFITFSSLYSTWIFTLIFSALIFIYLFYLFNNNSLSTEGFSPLNKIINNKYIYFLIIIIISTIILLISHWFIINTIIIVFLIFLLLFTFQSFLRLIFSKVSNWIFNTLFILIIILFFYITPLIFTNLLDIKLNTVNSVVKTALYQDKILNFSCVNFLQKQELYFFNNSRIKTSENNKNNRYLWTTRKCKWIEKNWINFYYFLYFMLNIAFTAFVLISWRTKKSK